MKKILVPTDFSKTSHDAYLFALEMAEVIGAELKVVHLYSGTFQPNRSIVFKAGMGRVEALEYHLKEFVNKVPDRDEGAINTKVKIDLEVISSISVTNKLTKLTQDPDVWMMVMGTTGEHDVIENLVGSVSTALGQKADCPVILVPKGAKFESFKSILFASNYESADVEMLEEIIYFGNLFRSTLHFVHVAEKDDDYENIVEDTIFEKLFEKGDPAFSFNMATVQADSIVKGLSKYADTNNNDLVVLVNRERDVLSNLMRRSITQKMGLYTKLPVMVFHI